MDKNNAADNWFALGTFESEGRVFPGLVLPGEQEERVSDLSKAGFGSVREILEGWEVSFPRLGDLARRSREDGGGRGISSLRVLPPVAPTNLLQSGANYHKHVVDLIVDQRLGSNPGMSEEELRREAEELMDNRAANGEPYLFLGSLGALCGAYDDVVLPPEGEQHDWELELAIVIGKPGRHVPVERAVDLVAGYTISNDITTRDLLFRDDVGAMGTDFLKSKNSPTFLPTGPYIIPVAFVRDTSDLRITLRLNGKAMQDESTSDMIFDVPQLISYASRRVHLRPGALILTGSPAGNGTHYDRFLTEGDVMECEITGHGRQRNRCVREVLPDAMVSGPSEESAR